MKLIVFQSTYHWGKVLSIYRVERFVLVNQVAAFNTTTLWKVNAHQKGKLLFEFLMIHLHPCFV
jgi:hypothetical protein